MILNFRTECPLAGINQHNNNHWPNHHWLWIFIIEKATFNTIKRLNTELHSSTSDISLILSNAIENCFW